MGDKLRIALFGGSFDPVHNGHLHLADAARKEFGLSVVVFVPARQPPHKKSKKLANVEQRLDMLSLALRPHPFFGLSHFEVRKETTTYTYQTLQYYRKLYPSAELFFVMGSDSLDELITWKKADVLSSLCTFIVGTREGSPAQQPKFLRRPVLFVKDPMLPVSSTEIRQRLHAKQSITGLVSPKVEKYILKHGLYR